MSDWTPARATALREWIDRGSVVCDECDGAPQHLAAPPMHAVACPRSVAAAALGEIAALGEAFACEQKRRIEGAHWYEQQRRDLMDRAEAAETRAAASPTRGSTMSEPTRLISVLVAVVLSICVVVRLVDATGVSDSDLLLVIALGVAVIILQQNQKGRQ